MLKIKEKKRLPLFPILLLLFLTVAAAFMFYMAFREQVPYWISDIRSHKVQSQYTNFHTPSDEEAQGGSGEGSVSESDGTVSAEAGAGGDTTSRKNVPQNWNGVDWNGLRKLNPDIIGWIRIPDLQVDYAILKGTSDNYYLNHHMDGSYNILGSIFGSYGTSPSLDDAHTILYGHNMSSGRMFGQLSFYTDTEFWKKHSYVYIYTPEKTLTLAIFNVYNCPDSDTTYSLGFTFGSNEFKNWISDVEGKGRYRTEFVPTGEEQIFTLSTCADYGYDNSRFVVNCMVIREERKGE